MQKTKETKSTRTEGKREGRKWELVEVELDEESAELATLLARKAGVSKSALLRKLLAESGERVDAEKTAELEAAPPGTVKLETLVVVCRVPERVAQGMRWGKGSLAWWCGDGLGAMWEGDFDGNDWEKEVTARFGCVPDDRRDFDGLDAGFVEAGGEAEKAIMAMLTKRAEADKAGAVEAESAKALPLDPPNLERIRAEAANEGRRLWSERGKWGSKCRGYTDYIMALQPILSAITRTPYELQDVAGLASRFARRLSTVPPELAKATGEAAERLKTLADACAMYALEVGREVDEEKSKALEAGEIAI